MNTFFRYEHDWALASTPERVFRALTDPAELTRWFAEYAQIEPWAGGVYRFWGRNTIGTPPHDEARQTITAFESNRLLAFQWPLNGVDTDVTMALAPHESGTTLTLTHVVNGDLRLPRQRELIDGLWRLAMGNLALHLAGGSPTMPHYFGL